MSRERVGLLPFGLLVLLQAAHSVEEYVGRLWDTFPPARFLTGLISSDREAAFIIANVSLFVFGVWCLVWPVRRRWPAAATLAWAWVTVELVNGVGHPAWSVSQQAYTPGVITAPFLLVAAAFVGRDLLKSRA